MFLSRVGMLLSLCNSGASLLCGTKQSSREPTQKRPSHKTRAFYQNCAQPGTLSADVNRISGRVAHTHAVWIRIRIDRIHMYMDHKIRECQNEK